jgi:predicted transcriptional regulator
VQRTNIYLDEEQVRALKHLAAEERQSMADLVREAVDDYLAKRMTDDVVWRDRLDEVLARVRARIPSTIPHEEIEADITAARQEVRLTHRAARRS